MKTVVLHGKNAHGRVALVDDADYELVSQYRWRVWEQVRNGVKGGPYAVATVATGRRGGRRIVMHTLITGYKRTDHKDGNGLNNQRSNLRDCASQSYNLANQGKGRRAATATSRYKGVDWLARSGKWRARIKVNYQHRHLGMFAVEEDAARAYNAAALAEWGEFAQLNVIPGEAQS